MKEQIKDIMMFVIFASLVMGILTTITKCNHEQHQYIIEMKKLDIQKAKNNNER